MTKQCGATMDSKAVPGHTHVCGGTHDAGDHLCAELSCGRYFWSAPKQRSVRRPKRAQQ